MPGLIGSKGFSGSKGDKGICLSSRLYMDIILVILTVILVMITCMFEISYCFQQERKVIKET